MSKSGTIARAFLFVAGLAMAVLYNHCAATHSMDDGAASSLGQHLQCLQIKEAEFTRAYYPYLQQNCAACHRVGGSGNGAFGDEMANIAFDAFDIRGSQLIYDRAIDPNHQPGLTGPQNQATLDPIEAAYQEAEAQYDACVAQVDDGNGSGGTPGLVQNAQIFTVPKTMNASDTVRTITWNLATEFATAGAPSLTGTQFSLNVQSGLTPTGDTYYQFSMPRLQTGNSNVRIAVVEININDELETAATTYKGINTVVVANAGQDLTLTTMIVPRATNPTDTIAVGFGVIEETNDAPIAPGALRFASLIAPGGVFANNCLNCHGRNNPSAGLDLSNYNQAAASVVAGNPQGSLIYQRMTNNNNPMPPSGTLNNGQISVVEDWILDGAAR